MKVKALFATAIIALCGSANAAIEGVSDNTNYDLFLTIYDSANDLSYVQDLEINYYDLIGGNVPLSYALDTVQLSIFDTSNASDLSWGLASMNQDYLDPLQQGIIVTSLAPGNMSSGNLINTGFPFSNIGNAANVAGLNGFANGGAVTGINGSTLSEYTSNFQDRAQLTIPFDIVASVDQTMNLYWFTSYDEFWNELPGNTILAEAFRLDLAAGTLTAVPVPAAIWLLASGLLGLGAVSRRRKV